MGELPLFAWRPDRSCGACGHLGAAIDSGIRYCGRWATWRWAADLADCKTFERAN